MSPKASTRGTLTVFLAYLSSAAPWALKMATLAFSRSFLSMPSFLGMEPTKMAASKSLNPTSTLSVGMTSVVGEGIGAMSSTETLDIRLLKF